MTQPAEFWQGIEEFNQGEFYACHDTLEALWMEASEPERTFYQGLLQIAVAFYHLGNHNLRGATILLGEGSNRLRRYLPEFAEIDVSDLVTQSAALLSILQQAEPSQVAVLAAQIEPPIVRRQDSKPFDRESRQCLLESDQGRMLE